MAGRGDVSARIGVEHWLLSKVESELYGDGYDSRLARDVRIAAERGCLLWTKERLTTTDASRIDARPDVTILMKGSGR